jgi:alkylation response protein AidB-like acyl-CoA dehydrogenase
MEHFVFNQEMSAHQAPQTGSEAAVDVLGSVFLENMTDEQKQRHLPAIAGGEVVWAQGYSEPEAGSDLASLRTRAERDGDEYVINGTKIWTSKVHRSDWILLLARTDPDAPKWNGISMIMADMKTPGITIRPIKNLLNHVTFAQVFLDDVRVPVSNLIGEENHGWPLVTQSLQAERSFIVGFSRGFNQLAELTTYFQSNCGSRPSAASARRRLVNLRMALEVGQLMSYRVASMAAKGQPITYEASMVKVFGSELMVSLAEDALSILGPMGQLMPGETRAPIRGVFAEAYQYARLLTIGGGASEIQRDIVARRGLGLARS